LSLLVFIIVLSILVLIHEMGHFAVSKKLGVRVEKFSLGFGPRILGVKRGDTEYVLSAIPLGGYVKLSGEDPLEKRTNQRFEYLSRPIGERALILLGGPLVNYLAAFLLFAFIFMAGSPTYTAEVGGMLPDYPAIGSGLQVGDTIVSVCGKEVKYWDELTDAIRKKVDGAVNLVVKRGDRILDIAITPKVRFHKDIFGNEAKVAQIGIMPQERIERVRYGFLGSFKMAFKKLVQLTALTYKALWYILTGKMSVKDSMTGPLGIFVLTGKAAHMGILYILNLMAVLSASLAIFNLLPLPVLDGGHIMFLLVEKLRGKPLGFRAQEAITNAGIVFLILLTVYVLYADIVRFEIADKVIKIISR